MHVQHITLPEFQCRQLDIPTSTPRTSSYSPHSAVSSCPSHFLAPPTPPFPSNPCPRRQRDRVTTAWLQLCLDSLLTSSSVFNLFRMLRLG